MPSQLLAALHEALSLLRPVREALYWSELECSGFMFLRHKSGMRWDVRTLKTDSFGLLAGGLRLSGLATSSVLSAGQLRLTLVQIRKLH